MLSEQNNKSHLVKNFEVPLKRMRLCENYYVQTWMKVKQKCRQVWCKNVVFAKTSCQVFAFEKDLISIVKNVKSRNSK